MASEAPQANVSIESVLDIQQHTFLATLHEFASVLGDGRAHHHLHRDELAAAGVLRHDREFL